MFIDDEERCPHCGQTFGIEDELQDELEWLDSQNRELRQWISAYYEAIGRKGLELDPFFDSLNSEGTGE